MLVAMKDKMYLLTRKTVSDALKRKFGNSPLPCKVSYPKVYDENVIYFVERCNFLYSIFESERECVNPTRICHFDNKFIPSFETNQDQNWQAILFPKCDSQGIHHLPSNFENVFSKYFDSSLSIDLLEKIAEPFSYAEETDPFSMYIDVDSSTTLIMKDTQSIINYLLNLYNIKLDKSEDPVAFEIFDTLRWILNRCYFLYKNGFISAIRHGYPYDKKDFADTLVSLSNRHFSEDTLSYFKMFAPNLVDSVFSFIKDEPYQHFTMTKGDIFI